MTVFVVGYFLSVEHSYASAGEATIQGWLYIVTICLILVTVFSGIQYFRIEKEDS
jgi:hypothetical protein